MMIIISLLSCNRNDESAKTKHEITDKLKTELSDSIQSLNSGSLIIEPKGTQILYKSERLYRLKWENGYILKSIIVSECSELDNKEVADEEDKKIDTIFIDDNSFTIKFKAYENCCSKFLCEAELISNNTLNIIYNAFGSHCSCNCLFDMTYIFEFNTRLSEINVEKSKIDNIVFNGDLNSKAKFKKKL
ncbi:hypothetical protein [Winogradskyella sp.]|uniref:hypothetical protein n=1 Tax=Winogradskyella sp. TaxID=1883156 RepID=UPI00261462D2|nr:hypothetical protein [Winogradskyella sp.]